MHDNNYWHVSHLNEGPNATIWSEKDENNRCPGTETGEWGYWDDAMLARAS